MPRLGPAFLLMAAVAAVTARHAHAGLIAYGLCQSGCNAVAVACYAAAGYTFGTVTAGAGVPAAIAACNSALGACMSGCIAAGLAPSRWARSLQGSIMHWCRCPHTCYEHSRSQLRCCCRRSSRQGGGVACVALLALLAGLMIKTRWCWPARPS